MLKRWTTTAALFATFLAVPALYAGGKNAPHVVVRANSLDATLNNVKLMLKVVGQEVIADHVDGLIKSRVGANGLEGIDPKRPFGAYARIMEDTNLSQFVAMIPIADEKAFLRLLANLNYNPRKDESGLYTVNIGFTADVHFRFANKYAYVTLLQLRAVDKSNLVLPAEIFRKGDSSVMSATIALGRIPNAAKTIPVYFLNNVISDLSDAEIQGLTETQEAFRQRLLQAIGKQIGRAINEGGDLNGEVKINAATNKVEVGLSFQAAKKTQLAADFNRLAKRRSIFAGINGTKSAIHLHGHAMMPPSAMPAYHAALKELVKKALGDVKQAAKRAEAKKFLDALAPTLESGEYEAMLVVDGPSANGHLSVLSGFHLKEGRKVAATLREMLESALRFAPKERERIKLDAAKVGDVGIHRIKVDVPDENVRQFVGDHPFYVAFRDDAVFLSFGENGLSAIKKAVATKPAANSTLFKVDVDLARIAPLMAKTPEQRQAISRIFTNGKAGRVQIRLQAGTTMRFHFAADLSVVQLIAEMTKNKEMVNP